MAGYDFTNKQFGDLTAKKIAKRDDSGHNYWQCECKCGNTVIVRATELMNGKKTMCSDCRKKKLNGVTSNKNIKKNTNISDGHKWLENNNIDIKDINNFDNIFNMYDLYEEDISILSAPIIYKLVHAINADLSFSGTTYVGHGEFIESLAGQLDEFFHMSKQLEDLKVCNWEVGDVVYTAPVYNLLTKADKNDVVTYDSLYNCLLQLYDKAVSHNNYYLAFPKICCGKDKLNWDIVLQMIIHIFGKDFNIILF